MRARLSASTTSAAVLVAPFVLTVEAFVAQHVGFATDLLWALGRQNPQRTGLGDVPLAVARRASAASTGTR